MLSSLRNLTTGLALLAAVASPATLALEPAARALLDKTSGQAVLDYGAQGRVTHLRAAQAPLAVDAALTPDARARRVLNQDRDAFLDPAVALELVTTRVRNPDATGRSMARYQQQIGGIPVRGGEVVVHMDRRGVTAVHSQLVSSADDLSTTPAIDARQATAVAEQALRGVVRRKRVTFTAPRLEFLNPELVRGATRGAPPLTWFIEATAAGIHQLLWIDAARGTVLLRVSKVVHAVNVSDFDGLCAESDSPQDAPLYSETNLPPAGSEAEFGYNNIGHAVTYFATQHAHDSVNGAGGTAIGWVNATYCEPTAEPAHYTAFPENAAWDGVQIILSSGAAAAEDVVGHEYTHGIIQYTSGLLATGEPGALAEGFADIFGEVVDLVQNTANDSGDARWAFGEDAGGGPFRNLSTPGTYGLPGKVTDANFYCGTDDELFTHRNGAVLAHAFALLSDGGTYNGFTITGIGIEKAARLFFNTMANRLTSASSFHDAYVALLAEAQALVTAQVITSAERGQVAKVLDAVELNAPPCSSTLSYCPAGQASVPLFGDDFENTSSGKWTNSVATGMNHWSDAGTDNAAIGTPPIYFATNSAIGNHPEGESAGIIGIRPRRGSYALWGAAQKRNNAAAMAGDSSVAMSSAVTLPVGVNARMQFEGRFAFEVASPYYVPELDAEINWGADGGVLEYSVNGGAWQDAGALISGGQGYTGRIQADATPPNPLGNRDAFVGSSPNMDYASTQLDLAALAGQAVQFRFRVGTDTSSNNMGWQIDDVKIYTCTTAALVVSAPDGLVLRGNGSTKTFTVRLGSAPQSAVTVNVTPSDSAAFSVSPSELVFDASNYDLPQTVTVTHRGGSGSDYTVSVGIGYTADPGFAGAQSVDIPVTLSGKKKGGAIDVVLLVLLALAGLARPLRSAWLRRYEVPSRWRRSRRAARS